MASHPPGKCCTLRIRHEGTPTGKLIKIANDGIKAYVAEAPADKAHLSMAIVYIPNIFGIWQNAQLMADEFASNGYTTIIPDIFNGDAFEPGKHELMEWIAHGSDGNRPHDTEAIDPIILASIKALKEQYGATRVGAAGYCFGAKYAVRHFKNGIDVGYLAHPSFVEEEELYGIAGPLSISAAETDTIFPLENRIRSEEILRDVKQPFQICLFSGVEHGFAVRCDVNNKLQKFAKEQAFIQAVNWFDLWL